MCRLFPCIPIFRVSFFLLKRVRKCLYVIMLKSALVLAKNVCFGVKKGISEFGVLDRSKTYCLKGIILTPNAHYVKNQKTLQGMCWNAKNLTNSHFVKPRRKVEDKGRDRSRRKN